MGERAFGGAHLWWCMLHQHRCRAKLCAGLPERTIMVTTTTPVLKEAVRSECNVQQGCPHPACKWNLPDAGSHARVETTRHMSAIHNVQAPWGLMRRTPVVALLSPLTVR